MKTHFATPKRLKKNELAIEIDTVSQNPVVTGLLNSISGLLAVLDEHRQIIALNNAFLKMLDIDDPQTALGLRLGEVLNCVHAFDDPAGCGTTPFCSTCGAAVATVACLGEKKPSERICALSAKRNDQPLDLSLVVRAHPITIQNNLFILLFAQDITQQQNRSALERTFFHDINNMLGMLLGASELLCHEYPSDTASQIHQATLRLSKEVAIQQCLTRNESSHYQTVWQDVTVDQILSDLAAFFKNHVAARSKTIIFPDSIEPVTIRTDISLILRVLCNMIINALEASDDDQPVKVSIDPGSKNVKFHVWNTQFIPDDIALRIFQRNFSTKEQSGRGIGTFSMKLFGENILGGKIDFTTSKENGTTFTYTAPV